jgi:hypothetical protein
MLFQVVSIQPPERWTCAMRNSSIWPLKGSANVHHMPGRIANLRDTGVRIAERWLPDPKLPHAYPAGGSTS